MRLFLLTMGVAVAMQGVAMAQETPTPPPPSFDSYTPPLTPPPRMTPLQVREQLNRDQANRALTAQSRYVNNQPAARRERAARLSEMANGGHCPEAIQIARDEGDMDMASRLLAACRSPASSVTVSSPNSN